MRLETALQQAGYRQPTRIAALDGLRAFAVVAVVVYHLDLSIGSWRLARGGFIGVDLFFVLSGYLIGSLLVQEVRTTGQVRLLAFWTRRFRRLLPASLTMMAGVLLWGVVVGWQRDIGGDVIASLFWFQNWHLIATGQSYVEQFEAASPLRHFWSLSIEEQWYLVLPVAAFACRTALRRRRVLVAGVLGGAAILSAVWMAVLSASPVSLWRLYYGTDTRLFGLLIGCALAVLPVASNDMAERRKPWMAVLAAGLAVWGALAFVVTEQSTMMYRGGFLIVSLLSGAAVVGAAKSRVRWFDSRPVQWLGLRSYGIYLWHWPVIVALTPDRTGLDGALLALARLAVTAVLVELSYRLIEQPVLHRGGQVWRPRLVLPVGVLGCIGLAGLALVVPFKAGPVGGSADVLRDAEAAILADTTLVPSATTTDVLVVGDSVAFGLGYLTDTDRAAAGIGDLQLVNGAMPGCGLTRLGRPNSTYLVGDALDRCLAIDGEWQTTLGTSPDVVLWVVGPYDSVDVLDGSAPVEAGSSTWSSLIGNRLAESFDVLTSTGVPLVVVLPPCPQAVEGSVAQPEVVASLIDLIRTEARDFGTLVQLEDPTNWACDPDGGLVDASTGGPLVDDGVHYTASGKLDLWRWLAPTLRSFAS